MAHIVHCRSCGGAFNRDVLIEGIDWVKPSNLQYYHKNCYEQWAKKQGKLEEKMSDDEWFEALRYYLNHIVKISIDWKKLNSQWKNLLKQKKTAKGIYFAIRYFYEVVDGQVEKSQGGIGIVFFIYQESCEYWNNRFERDCSIVDKIEKQAKMQAERKIETVRQTSKKGVTRKVISLEDIE